MSYDTNKEIVIQCRTAQARDDDGDLVSATVYSAVGILVQGVAQIFANSTGSGRPTVDYGYFINKYTPQN